MPEHEQDYEERRREMEAGAREMEERRERFGQEVEDAESDWQGKQSDDSVPGAQDPEHRLVVDDEVKERVKAGEEGGEEEDLVTGQEAEEPTAEGDPEREGVDEGGGEAASSTGQQDGQDEDAGW